MADTVPKFTNRDDKFTNSNRQAASEKKLFSERLSRSINDLGIYDAELARRAGVLKSAINRWKKGGAFPDAPSVFALSDCLVVNPRWLITGEGSPKPPIEIDHSTDQEHDLVGAFRLLNDQDREQLLSLANRLVGSRVEEFLNPTLHSPKTAFRVQLKE